MKRARYDYLLKQGVLEYEERNWDAFDIYAGIKTAPSPYSFANSYDVFQDVLNEEQAQFKDRVNAEARERYQRAYEEQQARLRANEPQWHIWVSLFAAVGVALVPFVLERVQRWRRAAKLVEQRREVMLAKAAEAAEKEKLIREILAEEEAKAAAERESEPAQAAPVEPGAEPAAEARPKSVAAFAW